MIVAGSPPLKDLARCTWLERRRRKKSKGIFPQFFFLFFLWVAQKYPRIRDGCTLPLFFNRIGAVSSSSLKRTKMPQFLFLRNVEWDILKAAGGRERSQVNHFWDLVQRSRYSYLSYWLILIIEWKARKCEYCHIFARSRKAKWHRKWKTEHRHFLRRHF